MIFIHTNMHCIMSHIKNCWDKRFPWRWKIMVHDLIYYLRYLKRFTWHYNFQHVKQANQLGGLHWNRIYTLPTEHYLTPHRKSELVILKLLRDLKRPDLSQTPHIHFINEMKKKLSRTDCKTWHYTIENHRKQRIYWRGLVNLHYGTYLNKSYTRSYIFDIVPHDQLL